MVVTERWLPPVGEVLQGRYQLVEFIGKGPIGAVFKAVDLALKRGVALKVLHPAFFDEDRRAVNAFRVQRARAFQHPNIVAFHDMVIPDDGTTPFVTEDLIEGLSLRTVQMLRHDAGEPLSPAEVRFVVEGVASALRWIHQLGVHGNLKPENIFLSGEAVKVTDPFFLVGRAKVRWAAGDDPLADHYLAPEQLLRASEESRQSDLFALGLLTGELAAGASVRPGLPLSAQAADIPAELDELFVKATAADPVSRYASVDSFLADLRRAFPMEGQRVVADLGDTTEVPLADVLSAAEIAEIDAVRHARNAERRANGVTWTPPATPADVAQAATDHVDLAEDMEDVPWHDEADVASASGRAEVAEVLEETGDPAFAAVVADEVTLEWDEELETSAPQAYLSRDGKPLVADDNLFERTLVDTLEDNELRLEVLRHVRESRGGATLVRPVAPGKSPVDEPEADVDIEELTDGGLEPVAAEAIAPEAAGAEVIEDDEAPIVDGEADATSVELSAIEAAADTDAEARDRAPLEDEDSLSATSLIATDDAGERSEDDEALGVDELLGEDEPIGDDEIDLEIEDVIFEGEASAEILLDADLEEVLDVDADDIEVELVTAVAEAGDDPRLDEPALDAPALDEPTLDDIDELEDEELLGDEREADLTVPGLPEEAADALPQGGGESERRRRATDERPVMLRTSVLPAPHAAGSVTGETERAQVIPLPADDDSTILLERAKIHIPDQPHADREVEEHDEGIILASDEEEPILLEGDEEATTEVHDTRPERPSYTDDATLDVGMAEVMLVPVRPHPKQAASEATTSARTASPGAAVERGVATPARPRKSGAGARMALAAGIVLILGAAIYTAIQYSDSPPTKGGAGGGSATKGAPVEGPKPVAVAQVAQDAGQAAVDAGAPDAGAVVAAADTGQAVAAADTGAVDAAQVAQAEDGTSQIAAAGDATAAAGDGAQVAQAAGDAGTAGAASATGADAASQSAQELAAAEAAKKAADELAAKALADEAAKKAADEAAKKTAMTAADEAAKKAADEAAKKAAVELAAKKAEDDAAKKAAAEAAKKYLTPAEIAANEAKEKAKAAADAEKREKAAADKLAKAEEKRLKAEEKKAAKEEAKRKKAEEKAAKEAKATAVVAAATPDNADDGDLKCPAGMRKISTSTTRTVAGHKVIEKGAFCIEPYEFPGAGQKPKVNVDWFGATRACEGRGRRLCTSSEWKRACGGAYPYGKTYDPSACNTMGENGEEHDIKPSGTMKKCKSGYGIYDMSGNVSEWTADKTINGGNAVNDDASAKCSRSPKRLESSPASYVGFRCCADPE